MYPNMKPPPRISSLGGFMLGTNSFTITDAFERILQKSADAAYVVVLDFVFSNP